MKAVDRKMSAGVEALDLDDNDLLFLDFDSDDRWDNGHDEIHPVFQVGVNGCYIGHEAAMIGFNDHEILDDFDPFWDHTFLSR